MEEKPEKNEMQDESGNNGTDSKMDEEKKEDSSLVPGISVSYLRGLIQSYIVKIGKDPSYNLLKMINKVLKSQKSSSNDKAVFSLKSPEMQDLENRSQKFNAYINDLQMIKFYSESIAD